MLYSNYTIFYIYFIIFKLVLTSELKQSKIKYLLKIKYSLFWLSNYRKYSICYLMKNLSPPPPLHLSFSFHKFKWILSFHVWILLEKQSVFRLVWTNFFVFSISNTSAMYILTLNSVQRSGDHSQNNTLSTRGDIREEAQVYSEHDFNTPRKPGLYMVKALW